MFAAWVVGQKRRPRTAEAHTRGLFFANPKERVSIRLDADVESAFTRTEEGLANTVERCPA